MTLQEIITDLKKTEDKAEQLLLDAQQSAKNSIETANQKAREVRQAQQLALEKERENNLKIQEKKVAAQIDAIKKDANKSIKDLEQKAAKHQTQIVKTISQIIQ